MLRSKSSLIVQRSRHSARVARLIRARRRSLRSASCEKMKSSPGSAPASCQPRQAASTSREALCGDTLAPLPVTVAPRAGRGGQQGSEESAHGARPFMARPARRSVGWKFAHWGFAARRGLHRGRRRRGEAVDPTSKLMVPPMPAAAWPPSDSHAPLPVAAGPSRAACGATALRRSLGCICCEK